MTRVVMFVLVALLIAGCSTAPPPAPAKPAPIGSIVRSDAAFDALVPAGAEIEKVASGFTFTEGPIWRPSNALWFSDVKGNVVRQWTPDGKVTVILDPGGWEASLGPASDYKGPNGMTADKDGGVLLCQHGYRRIVHIGTDMKVTTVVDKYQGKRLNSPNDLVYGPDGALYFTDPPYGLPKQDDDPKKELKFNGVYRLAGGKLTLLVKDMTRPNGITVTPDGKAVVVANSDQAKMVWMRYELAANGTVGKGKVLADVTAEKESGVPDGMKMDSQGNLWASGPGGVWVFSPEGKHLGTIKLPEVPANCAWGDDGKSLYITAETSLYRLKTAVAGQKLVY
jgi:gluconolactonase